MFAQVRAYWTDWQRGIPPSREWQGRGAQNPYLLRAFEALARAQRRAERAPVYQMPQRREPPAAFAARVRAQVK